MSNVIFLTAERIAQARSRIPGRHLAISRQVPAEYARRREHAKRMLRFAQTRRGAVL